MKILVTGSSGFIGKHVCDLLFQHGHTVQGVDAFLRQVHGAYDSRRVRPWEWACMAGDAARYFGDPSSWNSFDAVINLAAEVGVAQSMYEPARYVNANTMDTIKLWERVIKHKNIKRWVQASSMSVYGEGAYYCEGVIEYRSGLVRDVSRGWDGFMEKRPYGMEQAGRLVPLATDETKPPEPASVYARTKLDQEQYSLLMGSTYNVPTTALRFFGTYGEGQSLSNPYTGVAAIFACRALNGKPPLVYEDGAQRRDFVHVSDVARAVVMAVESPDVTGVFNVGTGVATTVLELAQQWCTIAEHRGFSKVKPEVLNKFRVGDVRHAYADTTKIKKALGWSSQVFIDEGLNRLADWIIANKFHERLPSDHTETAIKELKQAGLVK